MQVCVTMINFLAGSMTFASQYTPQQVMVAHILSQYCDFKSWSVALRIPVRFLFEEFSKKIIPVESFQQMAQALHQSLAYAANIMATAIYCPHRLTFSVFSQRWSSTETTILLCGYCLPDLELVSRLLPHRPERCWKTHLTCLIRQLEEDGLLSDSVPSEGNPKHSVGIQCDLLPHIVDLEMKLRDAEKGRKATVAKLMRLHKTSRRRFCALRAKHASAVRKLSALEQYIMQTRDEPEDENEDDPRDPSLTARLLHECSQFSMSPGCKRQYSEFLLDLSELIASSSPKTYRIIRQFLPLPGPSCLNEHFSETVTRFKNQLLDQGEACEGARQIALSRGGVSETPIISTIGIDAFAFRTFTGRATLGAMQERQEYTNGFLFVEIPLDSSYPVKVLHVEPKTNGSYDGTIDKRFTLISEALRKHCGRQIWFKATDGDPYLHREHRPFFNKYLKGKTKYDFNVARDNIHKALLEGVVMPIADPLHFAKNLRGRILDHKVAVTLARDTTDSFAHTTSAEELESVLGLGDPLTDVSQIGRMRDAYVVKLFTLNNVHKLLIEAKYHEAFLLFPYACLFTMLYSENLCNQSRVFLVNLAYYGFLRLYNEAKLLVKAKIGVYSRYKKSAKSVAITEPIYLKRILHTCLAFGISLFYGPTNVRLDSIGTHLVENAIGLARTISNNPKFEAIISAFAKAEVRKTLAAKYNLKLYIPRRINDGGAKVNTLSDDGVKHDESWDAYDICSTLLESASGLFSDECEFKRFVEALSQFNDSVRMRSFYMPNRAANSAIMPRNVMSHGK